MQNRRMLSLKVWRVMKLLVGLVALAGQLPLTPTPYTELEVTRPPAAGGLPVTQVTTEKAGTPRLESAVQVPVDATLLTDAPVQVPVEKVAIEYAVELRQVTRAD